MRIGIDLQCLATKNAREWTGVSNYAYQITKALLDLRSGHEFVLFLPRAGELEEIADELKNLGGKIIYLPKKMFPFVSSHVVYPRIMKSSSLNVLFGPANVLPWFYSGPGVITIHDLAIYKHPEWFPAGQNFSVNHLVPRSIRMASRIIVPSQATKKDLLELFKIEDSKVAVVPHGVEERFFRSSEAQAANSKKYILFVGTLEPRKNVKKLIEAYQLLPEEIKEEYDLVLAGKTQDSRFKIRDSRIKFLGYVPDEDLPALYQNASVFCYPSLYEGFGMPVLESLAAGVGVITSNLSSLPEVTGSAGILVDPASAREMASAMTKLVRDEAYVNQISKLGIQRAKEFTWQKAARASLQVFEGTI